MPIKGQSPKEVVHTEMHKFKHGSLHSGSKHGPLVKSRQQAIAIALSESGQAKKADGGAAMKIAYEIRRAEGGQVFHGPIMSAVPGRTDMHDMDVASGSYVLPSETVSHLGENNTMAGIAKIKSLGPLGMRKLVRSCDGASEVRARHLRRASGGGVPQESAGHPIPVVTAGGEHVLAPGEVSIIGDGDMALGHRLLDNFVMQNRKKHISTLQKLKPPAQD